MKINCYSITFWYNPVDDFSEILKDLQKLFKKEYSTFNISSVETDDFYNSVLFAINHKVQTNINISKIKLQYTMDKVTSANFQDFSEKCLKILSIFNENNIKVLHSSVFTNMEFTVEEALKKVSTQLLSKNTSKNLIDVNLRISKVEDDMFYKIITILNKQQIKLPNFVDDTGRNIPFPLISWTNAIKEKEIIEASYELNDRYSFDTEKNYETTIFSLNKMLYIVKNFSNSDVEELLQSGKF